jgi:hypothetical protein
MTDDAQQSYWWVPILTALIVAAAGIATALITNGSGDGKTPPTTVPAGPTTFAPVPQPRLGNAVTFDFDGGITLDALGNRIVASVAAPERPGIILGPSPETVTTIGHGGGRAVQFPPPCRATATSACQRAVIDILNREDLNPFDGDFAYGASLAVKPEQRVPGANVIQKGVSAPSPNANQWKIELENGDRPSCVVIGRDGEPRRAASQVGIADGFWHTVDCLRSGSVLTLQVDNVTRGTVTLPGGLTIDNAEPLRLGGNTPNQTDNRFAGALDDVYFARQQR